MDQARDDCSGDYIWHVKGRVISMRNEEKEGTPACSMRYYSGNRVVFPPFGIMNPKLRGQLLALDEMQ